MKPTLIALVLLASASSAASQEERPPARSFRGLVSEVAQVPDVRRVRRLRIAAAGMAAEGADAPPTFDLLGQRVVPGGLRRERFPELSYDRLVVVVQDVDGRELDWRLVQNPSIVRAEASLLDGRLQGGTIELDSVEMSIAIPDMPGVDRVFLYRPRWTGSEYWLDPIGQVQVGR